MVFRIVVTDSSIKLIIYNKMIANNYWHGIGGLLEAGASDGMGLE